MKRRAFPQGRRRARPLDQTTLSQALRSPNIDTRQWISVGLVTAGGEGDIVVFDEDEGQPLVRVLLEPSKIPVNARVASTVVGNGEGEWHPFVEGDEVVVAIPEGDERSGSVIIGRLNNGIDKFPTESVAGQDPTTNTFAFQRRRTPFVQEYNGPIVLRSAMSEALFAIDEGGVITLRDGQRSVFQMSPDVIGFQGPSDESTPPDMMMQLNLTARHFSLTVGESVLNLSASDATPAPQNILSVPDNLTVSAGGNAAMEHVMTVEAFWHCLQHALTAVGAVIAGIPGPLTGGSLSPAFLLPSPLGTSTSFLVAIPAASTTAMVPTVAAPLAAALRAQPAKLLASPQLQPGLGASAFLTG